MKMHQLSLPCHRADTAFRVHVPVPATPRLASHPEAARRDLCPWPGRHAEVLLRPGPQLGQLAPPPPVPSLPASVPPLVYPPPCVPPIDDADAYPLRSPLDPGPRERMSDPLGPRRPPTTPFATRGSYSYTMGLAGSPGRKKYP